MPFDALPPKLFIPAAPAIIRPQSWWETPRVAWRVDPSLASFPFPFVRGRDPSAITAKTVTFDTNQSANGQAGYSIRNVYSSLLTGGNQIRFTLTGSTANPCSANNISVGIRSGSTVATTATPTEIKTGGASGFSTAANTPVVSDWTAFTFLSSDSLLGIVDFGGSTAAPRYKNAGSEGNYFAAATASYNVANPGGFASSDQTYVINIIEARYV